jgi:hypothetical protein
LTKKEETMEAVEKLKNVFEEEAKSWEFEC